MLSKSNNQILPQNQIQILQPSLWLTEVSSSPFIRAGWILHFCSLGHPSLWFNKWLWKAWGWVPGALRQQWRKQTWLPPPRADWWHMGGSASILTSALAVCKKGGRMYVWSPLTLLPRHATLSRTTETLAKERENRGDTDWQENKCYRYCSPQFKTKQNKTVSVQTEHTQSSSVTT